MGTWPRTMKVSDVTARVKRQFGDESGVQITDTDILRWINDGQREIVSKNEILQTRAVTDLVANQADYDFAAESILKVRAIKVNGRRLKNLPYQEAEELFSQSDPKREATGEPEFWTLFAGQFSLYPKPSVGATGGLVLDYIKMPETMTLQTDTLVLPDRYFNTLVHYVLSQAYEQDEDWVAAGNKTAQLEATLNSLLEEDNRPQNEYYPSVSVDSDDWWY